MTTYYTVSEAREKFAQIMGLVRYGNEWVTITHHGKPIATIMGLNRPEPGSTAAAYLAELRDKGTVFPGEGVEWVKRELDSSLHPKQFPPDHPRHRCSGCTKEDTDWGTWLFVAGRGTGKTHASANWCVRMAIENPESKIAVVARDLRTVRDQCFENRSGVASIAPRGASYNRNTIKVTLDNGSVIQGLSVKTPPSIGMPLTDFTYAWYSEIVPGSRPPHLKRVLVSLTPKKSHRLKVFIEETDNIHITRMSTSEAPWISRMTVESMMQIMTPEEIRTELHGEIDDEA